MPPSIQEYLKENYAQYHMGEASIEDKKNEKVYEIELLNGFFREVELEYILQGRFLTRETFKD